MKTKTLIAALALLSFVTSLHANLLKMPLFKDADSEGFSLYADLDAGKPARFFLNYLAKASLFDSATANVLVDGLPAKTSNPFSYKKTFNNWCGIDFDVTREQLDNGAKNGLPIVIKSKKGARPSTVAAANIAQFLNDVDKADPYKRKLQREAEAAEQKAI